MEIGADSELPKLGLCRHSGYISHAGRRVVTGLAGRWRLEGFCRTLYARLHGWAQFRRCHVAAVDLLGAARGLGLQVRIVDEGGYWPGRAHGGAASPRGADERPVAALAGVLKDADDGAGGGPAVESPIFRHSQFERSEADGVAREGVMVDEAVKLLRQRH